MNPGLGLRRAVGDPDEIDDDHDDGEDCEGDEYLVYDGTALDVVRIAMPQPPSDDIMSGFTDLNREGWVRETHLGDFMSGPRRFGRTAERGLLIRPRSGC